MYLNVIEKKLKDIAAENIGEEVTEFGKENKNLKGMDCRLDTSPQNCK